MVNRRLIILSLIAISTLGAAYCWFISNRVRPNVILVVCDTLRSDHLGTYGYHRSTTPELDKFAEDSLVFTNAISAAPWTPPSMASIFTGAIPNVHGLNPPNNRDDAKRFSMRLSDQFTTLAEYLKGAGYYTQGISGSPWTDEAFGLRQGFDQTEVMLRVSADRINDAAFQAFEKLKDSEQPFFLYLHYMDVHKRGDNPNAPYEKFPPALLERWNYAPDVIKQIDLYDAELSYFDRQFGLLVNFLRAHNLYDNTVIVFTSDHGEQFKERGRYGHGFSLHSEELSVPLIVKVPNKQGRIETLVTSRDILATILDAANIERIERRRGRSLLDLDLLERRKGIISGGTRVASFRSFTRRDLKRVVLGFNRLTPHRPPTSIDSGKVVEFFDPVSDPRELEQIEDVELLDETLTQFSQLFDKTIQTRISSTQATVSDQTIRNLKSLGYLSGS